MFASLSLLFLCILIFGELKEHQLSAGRIVSFLVYCCGRMVTREWRNKAIRIEIEKKNIVVRKWLGLGKKKMYNVSDFDGYKTAVFPSEIGSYEYLFLMKAGKKYISISEFYHKNYRELKSAINSQLKNQGVIEYDVVLSLKELFF